MREIKEIGNVEKGYEVLDMVGDGGQGDLFLGRDRRSGAKVALKLQKARDLGPRSIFSEDGERLLAEGSLMMKLTGIHHRCRNTSRTPMPGHGIRRGSPTA
ncbi:hypothetical protein ACH4SP_05850 [Streptomyces sp. NPDC021093]|uniref:hypothetical protein n=1 Tax=Streptomyces sp. NPDC021093 TaxID=3365112 RepID=UPI0037B0B4A1